MTDPTLKPCPFCGGEDINIRVIDRTGFWYGERACCSSCGTAQNQDVDTASAITSWNTRAPVRIESEALRSMLEGLYDTIKDIDTKYGKTSAAELRELLGKDEV